uniref:ribosomal protein S2 n=1 Tax=Haslea karadagensis TaxID=1146996 RepID=UPI002205414A|nr:ribosomal protein S2 [Haslea karadagensis]UXN44273.1 ribosomal protein S2 [Haslea karadagensis]UXN44354.1 ribosomal protein S2 [Haslea karadagensis]
MKIKKVSKNKLIQLNILKSQLHKKFQLNLVKSNAKQTEFYLKKAAQIIYRYHRVNKRILFLGFPSNLQLLLKKTKHILIPESSWLNGIITNQILQFNYTLSNQQKRLPFKIVKLLLQLKKKIDLIVVFNLNKNTNAIQEGYSSRIPIIGGVTHLEINDDKIAYKVLSELKYVEDKMFSSNFFLSMVKMVLKKAIIMTSKKLQLKHTNYIKNKFKKRYKINRPKKYFK